MLMTVPPLMTGVKVVFAHDTEVALRAAADLVNTQSLTGDPDTLTSVEALDAFCATWGWTGSREHSQAELEAVRGLRPRLRNVWTADKDDAVVAVNGLLAEAHALPQLVKHDEWDYHLHATTPEAPLATRMAVEAAMALVDVIRSDEMARLRECEGSDCKDVLIDLSKNRSRRYCDGGCGNRANVAAYRARKAGTA
jgi:predicted RNA-binding Zn ribbon-like protein